MDLVCTLPSVEVTKVEPELADEEDIISNLPDSLLHHILSFLSAKNAVATSILSTRWQSLWMSITNLVFKSDLVCEKDDPRYNNFSNFVEKVMVVHSSNIKRFGIDCESQPDDYRVTSWVTAAVTRQVEHIRLYLVSQKMLILPRCLCISKTLIELTILSFAHLELPSAICLPNLKTLHLCLVTFSNHLSIHKLFSSVPVLENLALVECGWDNITDLTISLPTLKSLAFSQLNDICSSDNYFRIKVIAKNLTYLRCMSDLTADLVLDTMPLLNSAVITVNHIKENSKSSHAVNLLRGFCFAKFIKIEDPTLNAYLLQDGIDIFPTFVNMIKLEVNSRVGTQANRLLMNILQHAPVLQSIVIEEIHGGVWNSNPFPQCFLRSLKTCSLGGFDGRPTETLFAKCLLKNAEVLERLIINFSEHMHSRRKKIPTFINRLVSAPRASDSCEIEFVVET